MRSGRVCVAPGPSLAVGIRIGQQDGQSRRPGPALGSSGHTSACLSWGGFANVRLSRNKPRKPIRDAKRSSRLIGAPVSASASPPEGSAADAEPPPLSDELSAVEPATVGDVVALDSGTVVAPGTVVVVAPGTVVVVAPGTVVVVAPGTVVVVEVAIT